MSVALSTGTDRSYRQRLAALSLAMLLPSLGTSIANVALPTLAVSFDAPFADVQWVVISYLLAVTTLIVGAGRLGDMLGKRRMLLAGIAIFAVASAGGMIATNLWVLVAARALQGAGAAFMMALTVAAVGDMVPKERTGSAMGLLGTVSAAGTALGPTLGGALISWFGWQAVFAFMTGAAVLALVFAHQVLPGDAQAERKKFSFDVAGMALLAISLGAGALATTLGGAASGQSIAVLAAVSMLGFVLFVVIEQRAAAPLVQLKLLRDGTLTAGLLSMVLVSAIMMATLVVGPFYLSGVLGLQPVETGMVMSIGPGVAALTGVPAGRLVDRLGSTRVVFIGLGFVAIGSVLMVFIPGTFGVGGYVGGLALITFGYALYQAANNTAVMNGAAKDLRGVISALLGLSRNLGLIFGASAMGALFALGARSAGAASQSSGGQAGLQLTFSVAAAIATLALAIAFWGSRQENREG